MSNWTDYGGLYNWYAASDARNIAASGWRVPLLADFETLLDEIDPDWEEDNNTGGGVLKETGTTYWNSPNTGAVNSKYFNLRGSGVRGTFGAFLMIKNLADLWCIDDISSTAAHVVICNYNTGILYTSNGGLKIGGFSIRLIRDGATELEDGQFGTYTGNDGTVYETVCIGAQEWLTENLRETEFRDHSAIPLVTDAEEWIALTTAGMCVYDNEVIVEEESSAVMEQSSIQTSTYKLRYTGGFYDYWGDVYLIDFLKKEYTGESEDIEVPFNPLLFRGEQAESDPFATLKAKSVAISIVSHYFQEYSELFETEADQFICEIYYKGDLIFRGFVLPAENQEEYININHIIEVTAVDGLSLLDGFELVPNRPTLGFIPQSSLLYGVMTPFDVIRACLLNLSIGGVMLSLAESCDLYNDQMDEDESPLHQAYLNWGMFRTVDGYKDCYTALGDVVKGLGMRLSQEFITGLGLVWLLEPVDRVTESRDLRVFNLSSRTLIQTYNGHSDIKVITDKNGTPINVITDLSGLIEIEAVPRKLIINAEDGFSENLIKDFYNYSLSGVTVSQVYNEFGNKENTLKLNAELLSSFTATEGLKYYLGYIKLKSLVTMTVNLNWTGTARLEIRLLLYATDGKYYEYHVTDDGLDWYEYSSIQNTHGFYSLNPDPNVAVQPVEFDIPVDLDKEGTLVLMFRAIREPSTSGYVAFDLDSLEVNVTGNFKTQQNKAWTTLSVFNREEKSVDIAINEAPLVNFNIFGGSSLFTNTKFGFALYAYKNAWIVSDGTYLTFPDWGSWYDKRNPSIKLSYLGWMLMKRSNVYGVNRYKFSATVLGHMSYSSVLMAQDRMMVIDSWEFAAQTGMHQVVCLEVERGSWPILAESSGAEVILTEESQFVEF